MFTGFNLELTESELDNFCINKEIGETHKIYLFCET